MIRVSRGPAIEEFARLIDEEDVEALVDWVNRYINGPWSEERMKLLEATEEERAASIKGYIKWRIESSATYRIRQDIKARKAKEAADEQ